ncbi:MAG: hypothetical protein AAF560_28910, partial [Acidobacteriota bacterium]
MSGLPIWARWVVRWAVPEDRREDVLGDQHELHRERRQRIGRLGAWWLTSWDATVLAAAFLLESVRELWTAVDPGSAWGDLRLGLRLVMKQPLLNLAALLALTAGIGVATVGFTFLDTLLFAELPYENGDRYLLIETYSSENGRRVRGAEPARFRLLSEQAETLEFVGGKDHEQLNLFYGGGEMERVTGVVISGG